MSKPLKLNIFQRGFLQKAITVFVYLGSIALGVFVLDFADKRLFANIIKEAERQGIITSDAFVRIQSLIDTRDNTIIFSIIFIGFFCIAIGWFLMRLAAKLNWSWPVTIPQAVEFRSAMEQLGIAEPNERIEFVRKHKLHVFIALSPLAHKRQNSVRSQFYAFAHNSPLGNSDIFERHIGKQTLCLDAADFDRLLEEHDKRADSAYSARIVTLEENITSLKGTSFLQAADIASLKKRK